jgi:hypothetical protein
MQYPARAFLKLVRDEVKYCQMKKKRRRLIRKYVSCGSATYFFGEGVGKDGAGRSPALGAI